MTVRREELHRDMGGGSLFVISTYKVDVALGRFADERRGVRTYLRHPRRLKRRDLDFKVGPLGKFARQAPVLARLDAIATRRGERTHAAEHQRRPRRPVGHPCITTRSVCNAPVRLAPVEPRSRPSLRSAI